MINKKNILHFFLGAFGIEILSFLGHQFPIISAPLIIAIAIAFAILAWKHFPLALAILFFELFIGSKGHLFEINVLRITVSLRLLLFLIVFFRGIVFSWFRWRNEKKLPLIFSTKKIFYSILIFFFFLMVGGILGMFRNAFSHVFFDLNGYLYFAIFFIVPEIFAVEKNLELFFHAFVAAILWLFTKTFFLLFIFSHGIQSITPSIYRWVRDTGLAEPTRLPDSSVYRIFLQSHIFALIGFFVFVTILLLKKEEIKRKEMYYLYLLCAFSFSMIFISFSRSFFAAFVLTLGVLFILMYKQWFSLLKILFVSGSISLLLIAFNLYFPLEKLLPSGTFVGGDFLKERLTNFSEEAAAKSRWTQIPPLFEEIKKSPIIGHGFGKTVTYKSSDPRNLEKNPDGWYTTYAFEWGYLDMLLKLGILGLVSYGVFIGVLLLRYFQSLKKQTNIFNLSLFLSIISIISTHVFTPYLNHPLGIGVILIALVFQKSIDYTRE